MLSEMPIRAKGYEDLHSWQKLEFWEVFRT